MKKIQIKSQEKWFGSENFLILLLGFVVVMMFVSYLSLPVESEAGTNATVATSLEVGNTYPEILTVIVEDSASGIILNANATRTVNCVALLRDYNNESDFDIVEGRFFNTTLYGAEDNNNHYTNLSCNITHDINGFGGYVDDEYLALANCSFDVWYYANPVGWTCTMFVNDSVGWNASLSNTTYVNPLIAIAMPETINYGTVNATYVSLENVTNVTNAGNVRLNLSLFGYAVSEGDGYAMNCTKGNLQNISIEHEKYNVTDSTPGPLTLAQTDVVYRNLTGDPGSPVVNEFALDYRQDDANEARNQTYWRMYVPIGVAGSCSGNIVFGATQAGAS